MPIVEVNGQELEFPDDMHPDAIKQVLQAKFPVPGPKELLPDDPNKVYGDILPFSKDTVTGKKALAFPGIVRGAVHSFELPGKVTAGTATPEEMQTGAPALAMMAAFGRAPKIEAAPLKKPDILNRLVTDESSGNVGAISGALYNKAKSAFEAKQPSYDALAGQEAIANTYAANKATATGLYESVDKLARGKSIDTSGLAQSIDGLIQDVASDPFHEARGVLPRLQKLRDKLIAATPETEARTMNGETPVQKLPSTEKFDLADAVELKKIMNEGFKSNRWTQNAKGTIYGDVGSQVGNIINSASMKYPKFAQANSLANKYWLNNVKNAFQDNSVMAKYFTPDDLREFQSLKEGRTVALHDETVKRAMATLKNIKTPEDLNAIRRALPPEMAKALSQDVIRAQGNSGRKQALGKAAMGILDLRPHGIARTVGNVADFISGVEKTPEQLALIKAAQSVPPRMYTPAELGKMPPAKARAAIAQMKKAKP